MSGRVRKKREPTIALINVVFLMLVFFMVAGTLSHSLPENLALPSVQELDQSALPDALVLYPDGRIAYQGQEVGDLAQWGANQKGSILRILPDKNASATELLALAAQLANRADVTVRIVTERQAQ